MPPRPKYFTATYATWFERRHNLLEGSVAAGYFAYFGADQARLALYRLLDDPPLLPGPDGVPRWATNTAEQDTVDERRAEGFQDEQGKWHPPVSPINVPSPRSRLKRSNAVRDKSGTGAMGVAGKSGLKRSNAVKGYKGRPEGVEKKQSPKSKRPSKERNDSVWGSWFGVGDLDADKRTGYPLRRKSRERRGSSEETFRTAREEWDEMEE